MLIERAEDDLRQLRDRIAALRSQLAELEGREAKVAAFIEMAGLYAVAPAEPAEGGQHGLPMSAAVQRHERGAKGAAHRKIQTVVEILKRRRHPMHTRDLVDELGKQGIAIGGKAPVPNLSSILSRHRDLLVLDRSAGWRLVEWEEQDRR